MFDIYDCREKHPGSFDIVHIKDSQGHVFATRLAYVFVIGKVRHYSHFDSNMHMFSSV